jgi:hypothetical protein
VLQAAFLILRDPGRPARQQRFHVRAANLSFAHVWQAGAATAEFGRRAAAGGRGPVARAAGVR